MLHLMKDIQLWFERVTAKVTSKGFPDCDFVMHEVKGIELWPEIVTEDIVKAFPAAVMLHEVNTMELRPERLTEPTVKPFPDGPVIQHEVKGIVL